MGPTAPVSPFSPFWFHETLSSDGLQSLEASTTRRLPTFFW